jgi:hypothetical protein
MDKYSVLLLASSFYLQRQNVLPTARPVHRALILSDYYRLPLPVINLLCAEAVG